MKAVLDAGCWAGITLYPTTKMSPRHAVDMLECCGPERLLVNSSADRGPSSPFT
jgi:predicted metal-dependent TIM-barrel fold hydrolase